jgi:hypothetical protein
MTPAGVSDGHGGSRDRRALRLCRVARGQGDPCLQRGGARLARPHYRGGRPKKTTPAEREWIVAVARARPRSPEALVASKVSRPSALVGRGRALPGRPLPQTLRGAGSHQRRHSWKRESRSLLQGASGTRRVALQRASRRWTVVCSRRDGTDPADLSPRILGWSPESSPSGASRTRPVRHLRKVSFPEDGSSSFEVSVKAGMAHEALAGRRDATGARPPPACSRASASFGGSRATASCPCCSPSAVK